MIYTTYLLEVTYKKAWKLSLPGFFKTGMTGVPERGWSGILSRSPSGPWGTGTGRFVWL